MDDSLLTSNCRLCLSKFSVVVNIFENSRVASKIKECTNIEISVDDSYPKIICIPCLHKLNNAYKFKKKCEKSAEILKNKVFSDALSHTISPHTDLNPNEELFNNHLTAEMQTEKSNDASISNEENTFSSILFNKEQYDLELNAGSRINNIDSEYFRSENDISEFENSVNSFPLANKTINGVYKICKNKKINQCLKCGKLYKSPKILAKHMKTHYTTIETHQSNKNSVLKNQKAVYICSICGKGFTQLNNLTIHKRSHTGEKPYRCNICSKSFAQLSNLYVHKRVHSDVREFKCQICSMDFKLLSHLSEHTKTHSDTKEHQCSSCGKGFHKSSHLLTHMRIHTGEKPFSCEHCGKLFSDSSNLATHIRIHTGIKPFKCDICNKSFVQKISMIRHQKQKHDKLA